MLIILKFIIGTLQFDIVNKIIYFLAEVLFYDKAKYIAD